MVLFQRTTRKVDLTQAGEQLMISARKAMAEISCWWWEQAPFG